MSTRTDPINYWHVIVAALAAFVMSSLYYSPPLVGGIWRAVDPAAATITFSLWKPLIEILRTPLDADGSTDGPLTGVEAAIELVRCLRLRSCFPAVIGAANDERLAEDLLFAAEQRLLLHHDDVEAGKVGRQGRGEACRTRARDQDVAYLRRRIQWAFPATAPAVQL